MPDSDSEVMKKWDAARSYIAKGGTASWPRDWFESEIDARDEEIASLRAEVAAWRERFDPHGVCGFDGNCIVLSG